MELYQFSWGSGSDEECYSFFASASRDVVMKTLKAFKAIGGDIADFDSFADYVYRSCEFDMQRYFHEEPIYIHEDELEEE